ncbi:hypothetical protein A2625_07635 [candidate division WOR-1 bacterium RIFCSPHIGHO2_01_FULL_53_15]|uniref:Uncharacterized protein n=1 Tax=candidate division WOR-1 bacterium RIFCSPHIGHO2_01_FULL_53_15 TaxID=1802564 RepID=A0A1F4Q4N7_UNCSA|nr:MAG: hypothetical protein A2625_07635 [candidate division WOR-1 bacterium RIFCSPHIGHO2_01_FULL_53_15]OGC10555.1 MAG: hypothetical protein A3D23_01530 [candidate division WOR-1 bacterium RIFCSPHIGHO2_02_FULL_53_26]
MSTAGATIDNGLAQEKLYAAVRSFSKPGKEESPTDQPSMTEETMSSLTWEEFGGKDGIKNYELKRNDAVYLSTISSALAEDEVEAASNRKRLKFREKAAAAVKDKLLELAMDIYSHNYFVAELAKMGAGILSFQLSLLGVQPGEISAIMQRAKREKMIAVQAGIKQVASEKVLFSIVTGAKIA